MSHKNLTQISISCNNIVVQLDSIKIKVIMHLSFTHDGILSDVKDRKKHLNPEDGFVDR